MRPGRSRKREAIRNRQIRWGDTKGKVRMNINVRKRVQFATWQIILMTAALVALTASIHATDPINHAPRAICRHITITAGHDCLGHVTASDLDDGSFDSDGSIVSRHLEPSGPFPIGSSVVTLVVTDNSGATASCVANVTVRDPSAPLVLCAADYVAAAAHTNGAPIRYPEPTLADDCGAATVSCAPPPGAVFKPGVTTVICTATDGFHTAHCAFHITVPLHTADVMPLSIHCPNNISITAPLDQCSASPQFTPTTSGGVAPVNVVCQPAAGTSLPVGAHTVTCVATDALNATASCSFTVTVRDRQSPGVRCPVNRTISALPDQCGATTTFEPTVWDNCPGPLQVSCSVPSGSMFPVGVTEVSCSVQDTSGNSATCKFRVTVTDNQPPVVTQPPTVTATAPAGQNSVDVNYALPTFTDNCPNSVVVTCNPPSGSTFPLGITTVNCTVADTQNTVAANFQVVVQPGNPGEDNEPPTISCPANINTQAGAGICSKVVTFNPTASDPQGPVTVNCQPPSGTAFPVGITTVTCTATDAANNTAACTFNVIVADNQPPVVTPPATVNATAPPGHNSVAVNYPLPTFTDNCPARVTVSCNPPPGALFPIDTTTVNCIVTDGSNPIATSFNVVVTTATVPDTEPPTINCAGSITVDAPVGACAKPVTFHVTASDPQGPVTVACVPPSGASFPIGATTVTCIATDTANNTANCSFVVAVRDVTPPVINCPLDITVGTGAMPCSATVTYNATATDACGSSSIQCQPSSGSSFPVGVNTVTCQAFDFTGNTATCSFNITVRDQTSPSINCPPNLQYEVAAGTISKVVTYTTPVATDNCSAAVSVQCTPPSGAAFPVGITAVACVAADAGGASTQCTFLVTINQLAAGDCTTLAQLRAKINAADMQAYEYYRPVLLAYVDAAEDLEVRQLCKQEERVLNTLVRRVSYYHATGKLTFSTADEIRQCALGIISRLPCHTPN